MLVKVSVKGFREVEEEPAMVRVEEALEFGSSLIEEALPEAEAAIGKGAQAVEDSAMEEMEFKAMSEGR